MSEKFYLRWNDFQPHISTSFSSLRNDNSFTDVTLVSDDYHQVKAHRVVLATCSEYFKNILSQNQHSNPLLCLDGINKEELINVVDYIYHGEIQIYQECLDRFLEVSQKFQLQGLLQQNDNIDQPKEEISTYYSGDHGRAVEQNNVISALTTPKIKTMVKSHEKILSLGDASIDEINEKISDNIVRMKDCVRCNLCEYQTKQLGHLKEHIEVHFDLTFPCHQCNRVFKSRNTLRGHKYKCKEILH